METRRKKRLLSEDNLTISKQCNTQLKKTKKNSESIPIDLIIEILSRLPAKSIAKCRCLSKLWASTLRLPSFTELYLTRSSSRPLDTSRELLFFSAPRVTNPSLVAATFLMKLPSDAEFCRPVRGLVCLNGTNETVPVICNPSTRESLDLPNNVKTFTGRIEEISFLGYDPIGKQFKVLTMINGLDTLSKEYQVLTLGTTTNRIVECCIPHYALRKGICISGGLYYQGLVSGEIKIIWFDVRYEKFRLINNPERGHFTMVNYNGKLGAFRSSGLKRDIRCFELWVLLDAEKHEWSKHVFVLPSLWKNVAAAADRLYFVGVTTGTNEIVLAPCYPSRRFYVYYYDIERGTIRRVEIQGMEAVMNNVVETFLDHLEDVKPLLQMF